MSRSRDPLAICSVYNDLVTFCRHHRSGDHFLQTAVEMFPDLSLKHHSALQRSTGKGVKGPTHHRENLTDTKTETHRESPAKTEEDMTDTQR